MGTHRKSISILETCIKWGVPLLAIVLVLAFSPRFKPKHVGPGTWHFLGLDWVGPEERRVTLKTWNPGHDEQCSVRTSNHGSAKGWCWVDDDFHVTLEGYGDVPVDASCYDNIKIGDIWNSNWKFKCPK